MFDEPHLVQVYSYELFGEFKGSLVSYENTGKLNSIIVKIKNYQFLVDVVCMQTFVTCEGRRKFAELVYEKLNQNGIWANLSCAKPAVDAIEKQTGISSPPALTMKELAEVTEGLFQLIELQTIGMPVRRQGQPETFFPSWVSIFKKI